MMTKNDVAALVPQVLADDILIGFQTNFDFLNGKFITLIENPDLRPGRTEDIPTRGALGMFQTKAENEPMATSSFSTNKVTVTPVVKALEVDFTLEANGGYRGNLEADITAALQESFNKTVDNDIFETIDGIADTDDVDKATETISLAGVMEALSTMKVKDKSKLNFLINFHQEYQLITLKDEAGNLLFKGLNGTNPIIEGHIGYFLGMKVIVTDKVVKDVSGVISNYIVEDGAVGMAWAKDLFIDKDDNKSKLTYSIYAHTVYATFVHPDKKIQRVLFAEAVTEGA